MDFASIAIRSYLVSVNELIESRDPRAKVVGKRRPPAADSDADWTRFNQLQLNFHRMWGGLPCPKGVCRFKFLEECDSRKSTRPPRMTDLFGLCRELNIRSAKYIAVGGMAVNILGFTRNTEDIDLLIETGIPNEEKALDYRCFQTEPPRNFDRARWPSMLSFEFATKLLSI